MSEEYAVPATGALILNENDKNFSHEKPEVGESVAGAVYSIGVELL